MEDRQRAGLAAALLVGLVIVVLVAIAAGTAQPLAPRSSGVPGPPAASEPPGAHVLVGAGDIGDCGTDRDEATARVVESVSGTVFTTGDNGYPNGTAVQFADCYGASWGRFRERTRPVPGNHDYLTAAAAGYFGYFGEAAGSAGASWYAYDLGMWRIYALDSNCGESAVGGCGEGSEQLAWLRDDLSAHPRRCVAAYWHHPRFSSGEHGDTPWMQDIWANLAAAGADVVISGHNHSYERFGPLDGVGQPAPTGVRSFVVGTGGTGLRGFRGPKVGSVVREASAFGVLALTLRDGSYGWRFLPVEGDVFTDEGSAECS